MSVDVFGRQWVREKEIQKGPRGIGFELTTSGDFDINNKRLCNVSNPVEDSDCVNLQFIKKEITLFQKSINDLSESLDLLKRELVDFRNNFEKFKTDTSTVLKRRRIPAHRDSSILHNGS